MNTCHCPKPDPSCMAPSICDRCGYIIPTPAELERFNQRRTSRPIGAPIADGEKLLRCNDAAEVMNIDATELLFAAMFIYGDADTFTATKTRFPWHRLETITVLGAVA